MKFSTTFTVTVLYLCLWVVIGACSSNETAPASDETAELYYYPAKNIYLDEERRYYYYSLDGGTTWDSVMSKGADANNALGNRVPVMRGEGATWSNNETDRRKHNGLQLNIINDYTIALSKTDSIKRVKSMVTTKPAVAKVKEEAAPPKKGIKKFFNKIFGKKKKAADEN